MRKPKAPPADRLISAKEVAELLGVSISTVYQGKCGTEKLTRVPLGNRVVRWSYNEVKEFLQGRLVLAQADKQPLEAVAPRSNVIQFSKRKPALTKHQIDAVIQSRRKKHR